MVKAQSQWLGLFFISKVGFWPAFAKSVEIELSNKTWKLAMFEVQRQDTLFGRIQHGWQQWEQKKKQIQRQIFRFSICSYIWKLRNVFNNEAVTGIRPADDSRITSGHHVICFCKCYSKRLVRNLTGYCHDISVKCAQRTWQESIQLVMLLLLACGCRCSCLHFLRRYRGCRGSCRTCHDTVTQSAGSANFESRNRRYWTKIWAAVTLVGTTNLVFTKKENNDKKCV